MPSTGSPREDANASLPFRQGSNHIVLPPVKLRQVVTGLRAAMLGSDYGGATFGVDVDLGGLSAGMASSVATGTANGTANGTASGMTNGASGPSGVGTGTDARDPYARAPTLDGKPPRAHSVPPYTYDHAQPYNTYTYVPLSNGYGNTYGSAYGYHSDTYNHPLHGAPPASPARTLPRAHPHVSVLHLHLPTPLSPPTGSELTGINGIIMVATSGGNSPGLREWMEWYAESARAVEVDPDCMVRRPPGERGGEPCGKKGARKGRKRSCTAPVPASAAAGGGALMTAPVAPPTTSADNSTTSRASSCSTDLSIHASVSSTLTTPPTVAPPPVTPPRYNCPECGVPYQRIFYLNRHRQRVHGVPMDPMG